MKKNARIYVAGHRGLVGSAIVRKLEAEGYTNILKRTHAELDLPPIGEYVYFSVYTADGKAAHTRAFRRAELAE